MSDNSTDSAPREPRRDPRVPPTYYATLRAKLSLPAMTANQ